MLLKQFKGTGPGTIFLIIVTILAIWAGSFIKLKRHFSLYFDLDPMPLYGLLSNLTGTHPLPGIIFALASVSSIAILIVGLNNKSFFINERTFLPALIYILLSGLFPQYQLLNPAIFAAIFLMLAIRRIMESYQLPGIAYNLFDAGILIGIGSLFYANLIWFGLLLIIGIAILRTGNIKEFAISVIGLVTPYVMTFGIFYVLGKDIKSFMSVMGYNLFDKPDSYVFTPLTVVAVSFAGLCTLVSLVFLFATMNTKKIKSRKTFSILIWILIISLAVYFIFTPVSVEIVWITGIPVSYFLTHYFVNIKKRLFPELLLFILFVFILIIQIRYLG